MENNWKSFLEHLKRNQKLPGKNQLLILFLIGLLLLIIVLPTSGKNQGDSKEISETSSQHADVTAEAYGEYLEKRVAKALEYVEGVGRAEVVITLKTSGEKVIEKDSNISSQSTTEEDSAGGTRQIQDRTSDSSSVYEQQSDGSQIPYIRKELTPEIEGVLVIADGGDNAVTIQNITEAIQALFGVEAHKIKIMKRAAT